MDSRSLFPMNVAVSAIELVSVLITNSSPGRLIELSAILDQQSRLEVFSGTKQSSALRFTGTAEADFEAEELANVLDRKANAPQCSMQSSCTDKIEW